MKYKIKLVNGFQIRNTLDTEFGVIGSKKLYPYIPENEIWFDKLYLKEKEHFVKIHLAELALMKRMSYEKARLIIEKKFIVKTKLSEIPDFVIRSKKYKGFILKYVDGKIVRKYLDPKFILGCHSVGLEHGIFTKLMSKKEIWIDACQDKKEYKYTLIHELHEAGLMQKGMNYNNAHDFSIAAERVARRNDGYAHYPKD